MIPSAILNGVWKTTDQEIEFRILDLSLSEFTFRLALNRKISLGTSVGTMSLKFYSFYENRYTQVKLCDYKVTIQESNPFYNIYRVQTRDKEYYTLAKQLTKEYLDYIDLKLNYEDEVVSEQLTGYPALLDQHFPESFQQQKQELSQAFPDCKEIQVPMGIMVETPWEQEAFIGMSLEEYLTRYFLKAGLSDMPVKPEQIRYIYFGNQYCSHLLPGKRLREGMMKKVREIGRIPVYMLPPRTERAKKEDIPNEEMEIVVNDWGTLAELSGKEGYLLTMGIFLLKQVKDSRWRWKRDQELLEESGWMTKIFREYVKKEYHAERFHVESVGHPIVLPQEKITLTAPWYQMNTTSFCSLYARCKNGNRAMQKETKDCRFFCKENGFLYPEHLQMTGRYNSIFAYDTTQIKSALEQGADRLVWNFLL